MTIKEPVDRRGRHRLAHLLLVGQLNLRDRQHSAGLRSPHEWRKQGLLLVFAEVLMTPATSTSKLEDGAPLLGKPRVQDMHCGRRPAKQLRNLCC